VLQKELMFRLRHRLQENRIWYLKQISFQILALSTHLVLNLISSLNCSLLLSK